MFEKKKADAEPAERHAQSEIDRIRVYVQDIKTNADERLAALQANEDASKAKMREIVAEIDAELA